MDKNSPSGTALSLLLRLRQDPTDQAAWGDFVKR